MSSTTRRMAPAVEAETLASILSGMVEGGAWDPETLYTDDLPDGDPFVLRAATLLRELAGTRTALETLLKAIADRGDGYCTPEAEQAARNALESLT